MNYKEKMNLVRERLTSKQNKLVLLTAMITTSLCYYLTITLEYYCPDAYCEGYYQYTSANWASACGRWLVKLINRCTENLVIPLFIVLGYMICVVLTVMMLLRLWKITGRFSAVAITVVLMASPAIIEHFTYMYMALAFGVSLLLSTLYVYIISMGRSICSVAIGAVCLSIALGGYQSYIGSAVSLVIMTLIIQAVHKRIDKQWGIALMRYFIGGVVGCGLYWGIMTLDIKYFNNGYTASRVAAFHPLEMSRMILERLKYTYLTFASYVLDDQLMRKYFYAVSIAILLAAVLFVIVNKVRQGEWKDALIIGVMVTLIPATLNFVAFILTDDIRNIMMYQIAFIFPFGFAIVETAQNKMFYIMRGGLGILCAILGWTYMISANMTFRAYDLSNRHVHAMTSSIINNIITMPEYELGDKFLFAGFIDDSELRNNFDMYKYAINLPEHTVVWDGYYGIISWPRYIMYNYGIKMEFSQDDYMSAIHSEQFEKMGVYPAENSIAEINDVIVVKLSDNPPLLHDN